MNEDQLIGRLLRVIKILEDQRASLDQGSAAYKRQSAMVDDFTAALRTLQAGAGNASSELSRLEAQLNNVFSRMEARTKSRPNLNVGDRRNIRVGQDLFSVQQQLEVQAGLEEIERKASAKRAKGRKAMEASDLAAAAPFVAEKERAAKERAEREAASQAAERARARAASGEVPIREGSDQPGTSTQSEQEAERIAKIESKANAKTAKNIRAGIAERRKLAREKAAAAKEIADIEKAADIQTVKNIREGIDKRQQAQAEQERIKKLGESAMGDYEKLNQKYDYARARRASEEGVKQAAADMALDARQNLGAHLPGGRNAATNVAKLAQRIDPKFTNATIKTVSTEASTNISKINYEYATADGIVKKLTVTVDKFGNVLADTQKRFRPFFDNLKRDIVEVAKWSIAIAVVYGPMQKLGELTQEMIKNEAALADVTVALGNAQKDTTEIFAAAAEVAQATGESISGVIEAYNLAYRAAGGASDAAERFATANKLLTDSIVLSKLSTLDQAESIDLLSASLKQARMNLTQGNELLNSWVAVSKVANVDLETLATGFSVLGDAALSAGLSTGELNSVIAVIAESSGQSSKEVANTARAILSGFQSDQSVEALNNLGISIVDTSGKAKNFLQIIEEINALKDKGFISQDQYTKLSQIVGGGSRRGAAVSTFMSTYAQKSGQIISASENAGPGEAAGALAEKLDTVESATIRLNNAFTQLAQSLGEQGGLLDIFKTALNLSSSLVEMFANLTATLGKAGPMLYAALAGVALLGGKNGYGSRAISGISGMVTDLVGGYATAQEDKALGGPTYGPARPSISQNVLARTYKTQNIVSGTGIGGTNAIAIGGAAIAVGTSIAGNLSQGKNAQAIGNALGGAIGAGLGTAVGGPAGTFIGATVGSAIAEGFINATENYKPELQDIGAAMFAPTPEKDNTPKGKYEAAQGTAVDYLKKITGTPDFMGPIKTALYNAAGSMGGMITGQKFTGMNDVQALMVDMGVKLKEGVVSQDEYNQAIKLLQEAEALNPAYIQKKKDEEAKNKYGPDIEAARREEEAALLRDLNSRRIGVAPYRQGEEALKNMGSTGSQFYESFGEAYKSKTGVDQAGFFRDFARVASRVKPEELQLLTQYKDIIAEQDEVLKDTTKTEAEHTQALNIKTQTVNAAAEAMKELNNQQLANLNLLQDADYSDLTKTEVSSLLDPAKKAQDEYLAAQQKAGAITAEGAKAWVSELEPLLVLTKQGYMEVTGLEARWLDSAKKTAEETSKLLKDLSFQTYDLTAAEFDKYIGFGNQDSALYQSTLAQLKKANPAFEEKRTEEIVITSDKQFKSMNKDWKIVQYLLSEILKVNQKQLDGMYNLPDGSSFWVPYQAAKYGLNSTPSDTTSTATGGGQSASTTAPGYNPDNMRKFREADAASMKRRISNGLPYDQMAIAMNYDQQADMRNRKPAPNPYAYSGSMNAMDPMTIAMQYANNAKGWTDPHGWYDIPSAQSAIPQAAKPSEISAKMNININSTTNLVVDGKKLAQVIKPYLAQDMARFSNNSAVSNTNVVAS